MRPSFFHALLLAACAGLSVPVLAAGTVEVRFKPVNELSDVGRGIDRERNVQVLTDLFRSFAAQLPDGRTLSVEVLDVNLAGEVRYMRMGNEVRVLRGAADWPTLDLRWTLSADGRTLASGEDRLADMTYLQRDAGLSSRQTLPYEARMVQRWFGERVATVR
jgi:hypothetical protein